MIYKENECNIHDCKEPIYKHFMCKKHYDIYVNCPEVEHLCNEFDSLNDKPPKRLILKVLLQSIIHHTTNIPMPLIEHFPLEHVFLANLYKCRKSSDYNPKLVDNLKNDFNLKENENYQTLEAIKFFNNPEDIALENKESYLFNSKRSPSWIILLMALIGFVSSYIIIRCGYINDSQVFGMTSKQFIGFIRSEWVTIIIGLIFLFSGWLFPKTFNVLINRAYDLKLYDSVRDNLRMLISSKYVHESTKRSEGYYYTAIGSILGGLTLYFIYSFIYSNITWGTSLLILSVALILAAYNVMYLYIIPYFPLYNNIRKCTPKILLFHTDKHGGLNDYHKMLLNVFIFNEGAIILLIKAFEFIKFPWSILLVFSLLTRANHVGWRIFGFVRSIRNFSKEKKF